MLKKLIQSLRTPMRRQRAIRTTPEVVTSSQHSLRREQFSRNAVNVVERLQKAGYQAYIVGGGVRDQLLNLRPKDFDVATSATPEQVRAEFRNARVIGRRFKLVHVHFGREIIEVATFRANHPQADESADSNQSSRNEAGRILRDNVYGTLEDDAQRRDFTINALYFDVSDERILDYAHGVHDIRNRLIRLIGDPAQRYQEDPVRMLRAVRFAAKLDFEIEKHSAEPIRSLAPLLNEIPSARLFDEVLKLFLAGKGERTFELLLEYDLFAPLFPASAKALKQNPEYAGKLIRQALANTDARIRQQKPVTPAFLFAALLWPALPARVARLQERMPPIPAMQEAAHELIVEQCQRTAVPKRFTIPIREIWDMQERLPRRHGKKADLLLENPRFRAGYDFLLLRESAGEETGGLGDWWTDYQEVSDSERRGMIRGLSASQEEGAAAPRKRRRGGSNRRRRGPQTPGDGANGE
ncbi:MAG: Poly(A) polymerase I [Stenotrophomonas maltophilia]|nr:MAG: Poly(A) polymerase I [Stenotrophomonas maltophilia]